MLKPTALSEAVTDSPVEQFDRSGSRRSRRGFRFRSRTRSGVLERVLACHVAAALGAVARVAPRTEQSGTVGVQKDHEVLALPSTSSPKYGRHSVAPRRPDPIPFRIRRNRIRSGSKSQVL